MVFEESFVLRHALFKAGIVWTEAKKRQSDKIILVILGQKKEPWLLSEIHFTDEFSSPQCEHYSLLLSFVLIASSRTQFCC